MTSPSSPSWPWLREGGGLVTFFGSGGKTRLLAETARSLQGKTNLLIATTCRIYLPPYEGKARPSSCSREEGEVAVKGYVLARQDARLRRHVDASFEKWNSVAVGSGVEFAPKRDGRPRRRKLLPLSPSLLVSLRKEGRCLLVEGDGARGRDLKLWRKGEPVLPAEGERVCVLGCCRWGKALRPGELFAFEEAQAEFVGRVLDEDCLVAIMAHPRGPSAILPPKTWIVLNRLPLLTEGQWSSLVASISRLCPQVAGVLATGESHGQITGQWIASTFPR